MSARDELVSVVAKYRDLKVPSGWHYSGLALLGRRP